MSPRPRRSIAEHAGRAGHGGGAPLEDGRGFGDAHLATEREAECLERRREVLGLGVGRALRHRRPAEDVEDEQLIHGRSP